MPLLLGVLLSQAWAAEPQPLSDWLARYGAPTTSVEERDRLRDEREPLLVYWMQVQAAPLGVGPVLPGTLVANFEATTPLPSSPVADATFLAVATPQQQIELVTALEGTGWIVSQQRVTREAGEYVDYRLAWPDGQGTLSVKQTGAGDGMADGRPSPTVWMYLDF